MRIQFAFNPSPDPLILFPPKMGFILLAKSRQLDLPLLGRVLAAIGRVHGETILAAIVFVDSISTSNIQEFTSEIARLLQHCTLLPPASLPPDLLVTVRRLDRAVKSIANAGLTAEIRVRLDPLGGSNSEDAPEDGGAVLAKALLHDVRWDVYATWEEFEAAVAEKGSSSPRAKADHGLEKELEKEGIAFMSWFEENQKRFVEGLKRRAVQKDPNAAGLMALFRMEPPVVEFVKDYRRQKAIKAAEAAQAARDAEAAGVNPQPPSDSPPAG